MQHLPEAVARAALGALRARAGAAVLRRAARRAARRQARRLAAPLARAVRQPAAHTGRAARAQSQVLRGHVSNTAFIGNLGGSLALNFDQCHFVI